MLSYTVPREQFPLQESKPERDEGCADTAEGQQQSPCAHLLSLVPELFADSLHIAILGVVQLFLGIWFEFWESEEFFFFFLLKTQQEPVQFLAKAGV